MDRNEKIKQFWDSKDYLEKIELYTTYLGYQPIETITGEDLIFIYDCWQRSLKERIEAPLLVKIEERDAFIVELFNMAMHSKDFKTEGKFADMYKRYCALMGL